MPEFRCQQINWQAHFGGGEVFTAFLCRALDQLGVPTTLFHHPEASFWDRLSLPVSTTRIAVYDPSDIVAQLGIVRHWVLTHGPVLAEEEARRVAQQHLLTGIAHMPPQGRRHDRYAHYHRVFGVSDYVLQGLRAIGVAVWNEPLYGVADLELRSVDSSVLKQTSCYDWDQRKGRDRVLGWFEPRVEPLRNRPLFLRNPGLTLGIVSRLTPIKQFPALFDIVAPILARYPEIHLEIFGAGGYASVRDLRRALMPLGNRARFWGQQRDVTAVYRQLDYLMTGLAEKEALGLNVIEAQACDTPVLAVNGGPFPETVIDGKTGFLYRDPREDKGAEFATLLDRIGDPAQRPHPSEAKAHLAKFSVDAFVARIIPIIASMRQAL